MNILSETNKQGHLQVEKIVLTTSKMLPSICVDMIDDESIKRFTNKGGLSINNIKDWNVDYDRTSTSSVSITFDGIIPEILSLTRNKVTYITIYGMLWSFKDNKKVSLLWNIPCDLKVEDLEVSGSADTPNEIYLNLTGDIW